MQNSERRKFIRQVFRYSSFMGLLIITGCNGSEKAAEKKLEPALTASDPCRLEDLTEQDLKQRNALGYTDETPIAEQTCENCKLYIPENNTKTCGTCTLFKGPVAIGGYCTYWADKNI